jgi:amino acid transporter
MADKSQSLQGNAVGLVPVLFQSITTIAPAGGAASGLLFATTYAGGSTPLTIVFATVACVLVAVCIGQMARHLPSAGGLYTYVSHGLGSNLGFLSGWAILAAYAFIPALYWGFFGVLATGEIQSLASGAPNWLWAPVGTVVALLVGLLAFRGVAISTRTGVVLGVAEIVIFLALAISLIISAGSDNTLSVFGAHNHNQHGLGSVFAGMVYAVLALIGFEAAAPIAEEAEQPRRNIPRAIILSAVSVGVFYLIVYYAASVYFGPGKMGDFINLNGGDPFRELGNRVWGAGVLVLLAVLNSIFASCNGATNAGSRMAFSMARIGILPKQLGLVHPRFRTPGAAVLLLVGTTWVASIVLGFALAGPLDVVALFGTALTVLFVAVYIVVAISSSAFYWRERRAEFQPLLHGLVPLLTVAVFVPVLIASFGIDFAGLGIAPVVGTAKAGIWVALGWMVVGAAFLLYLRATDPGRVAALRQVFVPDEPAGTATTAPSVAATTA